MRVYLVAAGIVALGIASKVTFAGLGAGTFNITAWQAVLLALVGAALILIGWPWQKASLRAPMMGCTTVPTPTTRHELGHSASDFQRGPAVRRQSRHR